MRWLLTDAADGTARTSPASTTRSATASTRRRRRPSTARSRPSCSRRPSDGPRRLRADVGAAPTSRSLGIPVRVEPVFFVIAALFGLQLRRGRTCDVVFIWMARHLRVDPRARAGPRPGAQGVRPAVGDRAPRLRRRDDQPATASLRKARSVVVSLAGSLTALVVLWLPGPHARRVTTGIVDQDGIGIRGGRDLPGLRRTSGGRSPTCCRSVRSTAAT